MSVSGVITPSALRFLASPSGRDLLAQAMTLPPDRLTRLDRLRRAYPAELASAAVELLELRRRARSKFPPADEMFFTPEGLEQSTGAAIAAYRAGRFSIDTPVLDACCGIGGDALALARRGPVLAVDRNQSAAACTRFNGLAAGSDYPLHAVCADVTSLDFSRLRAAGFTAAFFDPSRRVDDGHGGRRRAKSAHDYTPSLAWGRTLRDYFPNVGIKVSPAIDDATLLDAGGQAEFISEGGECKEAVLWYGATALDLPQERPKTTSPAYTSATAIGSHGYTTAYLATVLPRQGPPATLCPEPAEAPLQSPARAWLYEPDPAVIRAHLIPQIAMRLNAFVLDPQIAYLTADNLVRSPFAAAFRVLAGMPFNLKQLRLWLRQNGRRVEVVKRRGVPLEPEEIRKHLAEPCLSGAPATVLVLTRINDRPTAIFCEPSSAR